MPSYVKNSNEIVLTLQAIKELDDYTFLLTADDALMCPNINAEEGLIFLTLALDNMIFKVGPIRPRKEIINAIKLLLRCNVFQFGDVHHRQKEVGAM